MDVVPKTKYSFFDMHDFDNVLLHRTMKPDWKINLKQMMLINEDIKSDDFIANTGVFGLNKNSARKLKFNERLEEAEKKRKAEERKAKSAGGGKTYTHNVRG
jgi:hypothetical protein